MGDRKQRESARLKMNLDIRYTSKKNGVSVTKSKDINMGGAQIVTRRSLRSGDALDLEIFLPNERDSPIKAKGFVVWQDKISDSEYDTGIKIEIPDIDDEGRLRSYVLHQQGSIQGVMW